MRENERERKKKRKRWEKERILAKALDVSRGILCYLRRAPYLTSLERSKTRRRGYALSARTSTYARVSSCRRCNKDRGRGGGKLSSSETTARARIEGCTRCKGPLKNRYPRRCTLLSHSPSFPQHSQQCGLRQILQLIRAISSRLRATAVDARRTLNPYGSNRARRMKYERAEKHRRGDDGGAGKKFVV